MTAAQKKEKIIELKERRAEYREKEREMLTSVQSYGIGTRNASRYSLSLSEIRAVIKELDEEIAELESGLKPRCAGAFIPRDW